MAKVDLHLVTWNRPKMTELVIKTIARNTKRDNYRLFVFDNGSDVRMQQQLVNFRYNGVIDGFVLSSSNEGLEFARQFLLKRCESELFVCIDNDCLPQSIIGAHPQDWLEQLVKLMEEYSDFAAISMRTQVMIGTGNIFAEADETGDPIVEFPHPGGSFRIMRTAAVEAVGGWDREAPGRGAEERYIGGKLNAAGFRTAFAADVRCLHLFGDRQQTTERWGYQDGLQPEETGHSDIDHPALRNGDSFEEVAEFTGEDLAKEYFNADSSD